jgi:hypothetical protein
MVIAPAATESSNFFIYFKTQNNNIFTAAVRQVSLNIEQPILRPPPPPDEDITPLLNYPNRGQSILFDADPRDHALLSVGRARGHLSTLGNSSGPYISM